MQFRLWRYHYPLHTPLLMKFGLLSLRKGLYIQYESPEYSGWGEIAPYPGLSSETLEDCLHWFRNQLHPLQLSAETPASVAWGLAMATGTLRSQLYTPQPRPPLPLNALLTQRTVTALIQEAQERYAEGYRCFKLKTEGAGSEDQQRILAVIRATGPDIRLRLDANRSWELNTALHFCEFLQPLQQQGLLDYLEEPLRQIEHIPLLFQQTGLPLVLDESLQSQTFTSLPWESISGLVLKPMLLGPEQTFLWARLAREQGKSVTLSSVFESSLGLSWLVLLAQTLAPDYAAGLDTWRAFISPGLTPPFQIQQGKIFLASEMLDKPLLSTVNLEEIQL